MSQKREVNSCPDGYRVLSTSELRELLQDEAKMDKIVRLSEKVRLRSFSCGINDMKVRARAFLFSLSLSIY